MGQCTAPAGQPTLLQAVYEQHWLHVRHLENERLNFASLYALLVAGGVALLFGQTLQRNVRLWLLLFLMLVTLVVGIITWRLSRRLVDYRINVDNIANAAGLSNYLVTRRGGGIFQTQKLLLVTYVLVFIGLIYLAIAAV